MSHTRYHLRLQTTLYQKGTVWYFLARTSTRNEACEQALLWEIIIIIIIVVVVVVVVIIIIIITNGNGKSILQLFYTLLLLMFKNLKFDNYF